MYSTSSRIISKAMMLKSRLYDYSDACILANGRKTIIRGPNEQINKRNKEVNFENVSPFFNAKA